jgi:hypothetical protein
MSLNYFKKNLQERIRFTVAESESEGSFVAGLSPVSQLSSAEYRADVQPAVAHFTLETPQSNKIIATTLQGGICIFVFLSALAPMPIPPQCYGFAAISPRIPFPSRLTGLR